VTVCKWHVSTELLICMRFFYTIFIYIIFPNTFESYSNIYVNYFTLSKCVFSEKPNSCSRIYISAKIATQSNIPRAHNMKVLCLCMMIVDERNFGWTSICFRLGMIMMLFLLDSHIIFIISRLHYFPVVVSK